MSTDHRIDTHAVYKAVWAAPLKPAGIKLVALAYAKFADPDGTNVYPGRALIMELTGYGEDFVRDATQFLSQIGVLRTVRKHTPSQPAVFAIDLDVLRSLAAGGEIWAPARERRERGGRAPTSAPAQESAGPEGWGARVQKGGGRAPTQPTRHPPGRTKGGPARPPASAGGQARRNAEISERRDESFFLQEAE